MKLRVYTPIEIEIPDELLGELEQGAIANGRFVYDYQQPCHVPMESIVEEALERGLVTLPDDWHLDADAPTVKGGKLIP